jgi:hypothetical protein
MVLSIISLFLSVERERAGWGLQAGALLILLFEQALSGAMSQFSLKKYTCANAERIWVF